MSASQPDELPAVPDFRLLFQSVRDRYLVIDAHLRIVAVTDSYLEATMTAREEFVGGCLLDVSPDNTHFPWSPSGPSIRASVERVLASRVPEQMPLFRHDVRRRPPAPGLEERYWCSINSPVLDDSGELRYVLHRVDDVTAHVRSRDQSAEAGTSHGVDLLEQDRLVAEILRHHLEASAENRELKQANLVLQHLVARAKRLDELKTRFFADVAAAGEALRSANRQRNAVADIAATVADARSLTLTLDTITKVVVDGTGIAACSIVLFDGEPPLARVAGSSGLPEGYHRAYAAACRAGRRLPAVVAYECGQPVLVPDTAQHPALDGLADQRWPGQICMPLIVRGSPVGVINILYPGGQDVTKVDLRFVQAAADQVAVAVDLARLSAEASEAAVSRERQRLARELHDSVTQSLFSMTLLAHASRAMLGRVGMESTGELAERLTDLEDLSTAALREMRALLFELRPQSLEGRSLIDALQSHAMMLQDRHGLRADVQIDQWSGPGTVIEEHLFRIALEALTNVVRHASASCVRISLSHGLDAWALVVTDDGIGFDSTAARPGHLGLQTMAERAERIGGRITVDTAPGRGATITVRVPHPVGNPKDG